MSGSPGIKDLKETAAMVLMDLMGAGKVGAGDLIKLLSMEDEEPKEQAAGGDYRIDVRED